MPRKRTKPDTKIAGKFGYQLMAYRKKRGMTQAELANAVGVSQRVISYYENESQHPPSTILVKLAETLSVSTDVLLCIEEAREELMKHDTALARKFIEAENLPASDRKTIIQVVDAMIAKSG